VTGWLTPDEPPDNKTFVRRLFIPADVKWLALFDGALNELTKVYNWTQHGELTPQETADLMDAIYQRYVENDNEPPDWTDASDVDGDPQQPWYEALEDWIIAGFLAITFTPQAALVYQTTVPKIRVAMRTGNLGALFRVLINGVEVWTGDSYAPITDLLERTFDNPAPGIAATVRVIHNGQSENVTGAAKLEFVRQGAVNDMVQTILRADPTGCGIQWSLDDGENWETIDLADCITDLSNDAILQAIQDGTLQRPGGQPSGSNPPDPQTCVTYHVSLPANSQWHLPSAFSLGQTIIVENLSGAWSDGDIGWFCPDGATFTLGACNDGGRRHDEGDVLNPGAYHMALVMKAGETYYPAPTSLFTNESGTTALDVIFQANDGSLADNTGSIEFDVTVCSPTCLWIDFESSMGGWRPSDDPNWGIPPAEWIEGIGWQSVNVVGFGVARTNAVIMPDTAGYTHHNPTYKVHFHVTTMGNSNGLSFTTNLGTQTQYWTETGEHEFDFTFTGDVTMIVCNLSASFGTYGGQVECIAIEVCI